MLVRTTWPLLCHAFVGEGKQKQQSPDTPQLLHRVLESTGGISEIIPSAQNHGFDVFSELLQDEELLPLYQKVPLV